MDPVMTEEELQQESDDADLGFVVRLMWEGVSERSIKPVPMVFHCYTQAGTFHISVLREELKDGDGDNWGYVARAKLACLDTMIENEEGEDEA